jgi:hypothetical protein
MRASFGGTGINVFLNLKDKEKGNKSKRLECIIMGYKNPILVLNIVGEVTEHDHDPLEEQGFHITGTPRYGGPGKRSKYEIYLSQKRFDEITNPDNVTAGGFFLSRCLYDRISINYFAR